MINSAARQALIDRMPSDVIQSNINVDGVNTSYLSAGSGDPVILLHGAGAGAVTWYPTIATLAEQYHVIAPDILGYGESDKPEATYDKAYFSSWLKGFMATMNVSKAHIVGLSQGGSIAIQFSLDHSQSVDKLVLVNSGGLGAKPSLGVLFNMVWMNHFPSRLANYFFSRYILFEPSKRDPNHALYSIEVLKSFGGKNAFSRGKGAAVSQYTDDSLKKIESKTLLIWGENDRLFPVQYGERAAAIIPNAQFVRIPQAGHLALMDQTENFNKVLSDFLKE